MATEIRAVELGAKQSGGQCRGINIIFVVVVVVVVIVTMTELVQKEQKREESAKGD